MDKHEQRGGRIVGDLRQDFSRREFACKDGCGRDLPTDELLDLLQRARSGEGRPLRIVSGVRCRDHNAAIGGSRASQHVHGRAADVPAGWAPMSLWRAYGAVGMGIRRGQVVHVDVRPDRSPFTFAD